MAGWIDNTVVVIITGAGLAILYKALKEPVDFVFRLLGRGLGKVKDTIAGSGESAGGYYEEIRYG